MSSQVVCQRCSHSFEIDEADSSARICTHCGKEWTADQGELTPDTAANESASDAPQLVSEVASAVNALAVEEVEYDFEATTHDSVASDPPTECNTESHEAEMQEAAMVDSIDREEGRKEEGNETAEIEISPVAHDWQRIAAKPRPKRQEASFLSKILPPILGGLSAVPISIAILWYGLGRDLGNAGPTVAQYVPWVVPEALRGPQRRKLKTYEDTDPSMRGNRDFGVLGGRSKDFPNLSRSKPQTGIDDSRKEDAVDDEPSSIVQTPDESMIAGDPSEFQTDAEMSPSIDKPSEESIESAEEESLGRSSLGRMGMGGMGMGSMGKTADPNGVAENAAKEMPAEDKPLDFSLLDAILKDQSPDTDPMQRTDAIVQSIQSMRDSYDASEPTQPSERLDWDVYKETIHIAEIWGDRISTPGTVADLPESFRALLEKNWYWESLARATSGRFAELYPPEISETVVWPVHRIATDINDTSEQNGLMEPCWRIGYQVVHCKIANDTVAQRIREIGERSDQVRWLMIGSVERVDELGIVIRVEGILP